MTRAVAAAVLLAVVVGAGLVGTVTQAFAQETSTGSITVQSVRVSPVQPAPGDTLTVTASVTNYGTSTAEQMLELVVNGRVVGSQLVGLDAGGGREVSFTFEAPNAGDMQVTVGGVTEVVRVVEPAPAVAPAPASTGASEGKMRVGPSVRLDTRQNEIDEQQDAVIDLFWNNSELNDLSVRIEVAVDVPSGLYIYSADGAIACAAGRCLGTFTAPPGSVRNMPIIIKADREGSYFIQLNGRYWPEGDRDRWNPMSLSTPINVREASPEPENSEPTGEVEGWEEDTPWWLTPPALLLAALLAIVVVVTAGYRAIPKALKSARSKISIG